MELRAREPGASARCSSLRSAIDDGDQVDLAAAAQPRGDGGAGRRLPGSAHAAALHRVVGVARIAQVAEEAQQVPLVKKVELHVHGAREKIDGAGLAGQRLHQLLPVHAISQVEQLALVADARHGVGPLKAPLLAENVQALELLVHVELFGDFALLLRDERKSVGILLALALGREELGLRARAAIPRAGNEEDAGADEEHRREERHDELAQLFLRKRHGRLLARMMVKRGASLESRPPMSPVSVPSEVTSNGSCVRNSW